ncbi:SPFH domain-containing protein [Knoellia aerolata]|uniref:Band 7 domain-containing protein n=1 Tax=Knoellia aerolata DSM 18566 TaxID=1385519 RepID=A0A0A0JY70_9MICO|nr:SPFH domain-containing protein [Knoellia aerolata]KGN42415.1 hypothetical protein N801_17285 [Knoellia aerolata DSM 18566]
MESLVAWLAVPCAVLLLAVVSSVRVVAEQQRAVVTRLGRTHRVGGPGLVVHLPGVERISLVSLHPTPLTVVVPTVTRDGVDVRVIGTVTCQVVDAWRASVPEPGPVAASALTVEVAIARGIARLDLVGLLTARERLETSILEEVNATTSAWGVEVVGLELTDFETRLTAALLRGAGTPGSRSRP